MRTQSLYTDAVLTDIPIAPHPRIHIHIQRRRCCDAYRFVYVYQMEIGTRGPRRGNTSFLGLNNNGTFLHSLSAIGIMRGCQYVFSFSLGHPQKFFHFLPIFTHLIMFKLFKQRDSNFTVFQENQLNYPIFGESKKV